MQQLLSITWVNHNNQNSLQTTKLYQSNPEMKCKKKFWETMLSMLVKIKHFEVYRKEKVDQKKKS